MRRLGEYIMFVWNNWLCCNLSVFYKAGDEGRADAALRRLRLLPAREL